LQGLSQLLAFLGLDPPQSLQDQLCALIQHKPGSVHRWRSCGGLSPFDAADIAYVQAMGFDVNEVAPVDASEAGAVAAQDEQPAGMHRTAEKRRHEQRGAQ
jgi:hypothetical protein